VSHAIQADGLQHPTIVTVPYAMPTSRSAAAACAVQACQRAQENGTLQQQLRPCAARYAAPMQRRPIRFAGIRSPVRCLKPVAGPHWPAPTDLRALVQVPRLRLRERRLRPPVICIAQVHSIRTRRTSARGRDCARSAVSGGVAYPWAAKARLDVPAQQISTVRLCGIQRGQESARECRRVPSCWKAVGSWHGTGSGSDKHRRCDTKRVRSDMMAYQCRQVYHQSS
jgi:hypothetical protein